MSRYLFYYNGRAQYRNIPALTSSEEWGRLLREFAGNKTDANGIPEYAEAIRYNTCDVTPQGIPYDWELAGPDGASFRLHLLRNETKEQIDEAVRFLRNTQDVVRIILLKATLIEETPCLSTSQAP